MNTLGYEVGTLGNHEFNYGLEFLDTALAGANFPFVSANLVKGELAADPLSDTTYIAALPHRRKGTDRRRRRQARPSRSASSASCRRRS